MLNYEKPIVLTYSTEELENLFQPFHQCHGSGNTYTKGSGSSGCTTGDGRAYVNNNPCAHNCSNGATYNP